MDKRMYVCVKFGAISSIWCVSLCWLVRRPCSEEWDCSPHGTRSKDSRAGTKSLLMCQTRGHPPVKTFTESSGKEKNIKSVKVLVHSGHAKNYKQALTGTGCSWLDKASFIVHWSGRNVKTSARVWVPRVKIYDLYQLLRPVTMIHDSQIILGRHWCKWKYFLSHRCRHQETLVEVSCGVCVNVWTTTTSASFKLCWPQFLTASLGLRPRFSDIWDEIANYIPFRNLQRYSNFKKMFASNWEGFW